MWHVKYEVEHEGCAYTYLSKKYIVYVYSYFLRTWKENGYFYYMEYHLLKGDKDNIENFVKELDKEKKVEIIANQKNILITLTKEKHITHERTPIFQGSIMQPKPVVVQPNGIKIWEFMHWDRKLLTDISEMSNKIKAKLVFIKKADLNDLSFVRPAIVLPPKQKEAIKLAVGKGYYEYPKRIHLKELSKIQNTSFSAYRENLKKAETKVLSELNKFI